MGICVHLSGGRIRVICGSRNKKGVVINKLVSAPMPDGAMINGVITGDADIKDALKKLWKENRLPKGKIGIVIDSGSVAHKALTVPITNSKNICDIIRREFAELEGQDMIFDYTVQQPLLPEGGGQILAFGAERTFIGSYVDLFGGIRGVKIGRITSAQESAVSFMRSCPAMQGGTYIIAVIDGNILSLMLFAENLYKFSNRSRLLAEEGTPEYADEIAYAISSLIQFNRSESTDIFFFGINENNSSSLQNVRMTLDHHRITVFPYMDEMVRLKIKKTKKTQSFTAGDLTEFMYCIGCIR